MNRYGPRGMSGIVSAAFAGAADYSFEPVKVEVKNGAASELAVRLVQAATHRAAQKSQPNSWFSAPAATGRFRELWRSGPAPWPDVLPDP